jgi:hypothetical protein
MKKRVLLSVFLLVLFVFAVAFVVQASQANQLEKNHEFQHSVIQQNLPVPQTDTVFITKSGDKFHRAGCRYLKKSCIPIERSEAIKQGYTACSICKL